MISAGKNITGSADALQKVTVKYLYDSLRNPKPELEATIRQLRIVHDLDAKKYSSLKRQLPYVVCGMFNPPFRKNSNFAYTEYFIIDIDHLSDKELEIEDTRKRIIGSPRVMLCFSSPSGDGLKVLFKLKERCYDAGIYSLFYKTFVAQFAASYGIQQVIDTRTSDVSRACFVSIDANAYYNADAELIDINDYLSMSDPQALFDQKHVVEKAEKNIAAEQKPENQTPADPDQEAMARIKAMLNPRATTKAAKANVYVPSELEQIMDDLKKQVEQTGLQMSEVLSIQYGKKMRFKLGLKLAEINLFYGKHGFTVVQSPRSGTNAELNELAANVVQNYIDEH